MSIDLVTCGFTTYNAEKTIRRALLSAYNQTYNNIEIIVVDDKSTDNTLIKLKEVLYNSPYPYKIIKHKENLGVAASRNSILKYAKLLIGCPYRWGGKTSLGFDCSGFIQTIYFYQELFQKKAT